MNEFIQLLKPIMLSIAICTPRFLVAFIVAPILNPQAVHGITRNSIVLSFSVIIFPMVFPMVTAQQISGFLFVALLVKEAVIGMFLGFLTGLFFWGVQAVGNYIDYQRGAFTASIVDPVSGNQTSPTGSFMMQLTILLFFCCGGFIIFLSGVYESYRVWPVMSFFPSIDKDFTIFFLSKTDDMMRLAFILAAPLIISLFLTDFGMGLINRFAPQLNVYFLSMPIKSAVAGLILVLYLRFLLFYLKEDFAEHLNVFRLLKQVVQ